MNLKVAQFEGRPIFKTAPKQALPTFLIPKLSTFQPPLPTGPPPTKPPLPTEPPPSSLAKPNSFGKIVSRPKVDPFLLRRQQRIRKLIQGPRRSAPTLKLPERDEMSGETSGIIEPRSDSPKPAPEMASSLTVEVSRKIKSFIVVLVCSFKTV